MCFCSIIWLKNNLNIQKRKDLVLKVWKFLLPNYDGQSRLFGVKRKMQQCTRVYGGFHCLFADHQYSLSDISYISSIWIWRNVSHTLLSHPFNEICLFILTKSHNWELQLLPCSALLFVYDLTSIQCVPQQCNFNSLCVCVCPCGILECRER